MEAKQRNVIRELEQGKTVTASCKAAGVKRRQFYDWLKNDEDFREQIMHSDLADIITIDDVVFVKAMSGSTADRQLFYQRREGIKGEQPTADDEDIAQLKRRLGLK